jgi:phosphoserine phosphatase
MFVIIDIALEQEDCQTAYLFDFDGTITSVELLPLIACELGLEHEMADLTRRTILGELPFSASFQRRVEMLAEVPLETVREIVASAPTHQKLVRWMSEHRQQCWIVTGNLDCWVGQWIADHGFRGYTSRAEILDGRVSVAEVLRKETVMADFEGVRTVMVGDGANDARLMGRATVGVACSLVHDAADEVREVADYVALDEESLCVILSRL